jgi:hypothetical protein
MAEVSKQHAALVHKMAAGHKLKIQEYENNVAHYVQLNEEHKAAISDLSIKLSDSDCSFIELDSFARNEPERQQGAIKLALVCDNLPLRRSIFISAIYIIAIYIILLGKLQT